MLYLEDAEHADIRADGSCTERRHFARGTICLVDLADGATIRLHRRLRSLAFVLPRTLFSETAELSPETGPRRLICRRGEADPVLCNLGTALLAFFSGTGTAPAPLRPVAVAICAHLLHRYGEPFGGRDRPAQGGLMREGSKATLQPIAAQIESAKSHLANHALSLEDIARVCGFDSLAHLEKVFVGETGVMPSAWRRRGLH
ncbi:helix-turn-helix domain-containing protein [Ensifer adhaerens]|uniref:helix-turn-helix domain-containing protein n=1 Tax=Ensifer adhaerens TaxID=106592 RepID=UPI0011789F6A|nr:helix-turn-helix domain-containing protein [Ensifer adhaerens]